MPDALIFYPLEALSRVITWVCWWSWPRGGGGKNG